MVLFEVANLLFLVLAAQAVPAFQADCENTQTCLATFTNTYTTLCNQNSEFGASDCSQLELHINGLESFMEKICAATAVITHTSRHNYRPTWYPLVPITMGSFDVGRTSIQTFHLPFTVAHSESIEVLIYVWIKVGYAYGGRATVKFYTQDEDGNQYSKYMTTEGYAQNAHTYTTENMWFPLTNGIFYVKMLQTFRGNVETELKVIGHR